MRITAREVHMLGEYASTVTGGRFHFGHAYNPGDGMRYCDGADSTRSWFGRNGARCAAAFYAGVIDQAAPGTLGDRPAEVQALVRFLVNWRESAVNVGREAYSESEATRVRFGS